MDSRIAEIHYEITYGEKKNIDPYSSRADLIDSAIRSGTATPMPRGMSQSLSSMRGQSYA